MDALEFYIGELEQALHDLENGVGGPFSPAGVLALREAARAVITAWDAENTPPEA